MYAIWGFTPLNVVDESIKLIVLNVHMYIHSWLLTLCLHFLPTLYIRVRPWPQPFFACLTQDEKTQPVGTENPKNTTGWWFQPNWNILVDLDHFPK